MSDEEQSRARTDLEGNLDAPPPPNGSTLAEKFTEFINSEPGRIKLVRERTEPDKFLHVFEHPSRGSIIRQYYYLVVDQERNSKFQIGMSLHVEKNGDIAVSWGVSTAFNPGGMASISRINNVDIALDGLSINLFDLVDRDNIIIWDVNGKLRSRKKYRDGFVFVGVTYDVPDKIDIEGIKSERIKPQILDDPFGADSKYDVFWKAGNPLDFVGLKPRKSSPLGASSDSASK